MSRNGTIFPTVRLNELPSATLAGKSEPYRPVILVVDGDPAIADSLADILKQNGYAAISAYDGLSALETAQLMPPEMLISEVILPGMNGVELAVALRRTFSDCKVILCSGHEHLRQQLAPPDCAGEHFVFLGKPVLAEDLLARVSKAFDLRNEPMPARSRAERAQFQGWN
jgi:DNA-binding NtrC family response regulator